MYSLVSKRYLAKSIFEMEIFAPRVAKKCNAGQFVIIRVDERGERIPLTISDFDRDKQTVKIVTQAVGATTLKLSRLNGGDSLCDFVGPLGNPSDLVTDLHTFKGKKIVFVAGGVVTASAGDAKNSNLAETYSFGDIPYHTGQLYKHF